MKTQHITFLVTLYSLNLRRSHESAEIITERWLEDYNITAKTSNLSGYMTHYTVKVNATQQAEFILGYRDNVRFKLGIRNISDGNTDHPPHGALKDRRMERTDHASHDFALPDGSSQRIVTCSSERSVVEEYCCFCQKWHTKKGIFGAITNKHKWGECTK